VVIASDVDAVYRVRVNLLMSIGLIPIGRMLIELWVD
jgi:hypothetical protein